MSGRSATAWLADATQAAVTSLIWERLQEQAMLHHRRGAPIVPLQLWARGLDLARQHCRAGDPRLAASFTNHAIACAWRGRHRQARRDFTAAFAVWNDSWRWLAQMRPAGSDRALTSADRAEFASLAVQGRLATAALQETGNWEIDSLQMWRWLRPPAMSDLRRLLAGVYLIASRPPRIVN